MQLGGIGYMTFGSFLALATKKELTAQERGLANTVFSLPRHFKIERFILSVIWFSLLIEAAGSVWLYFIFVRAGIAHPVWNAIFHTISAFCTAGLSLFPNNLESLATNFDLNLAVSILSILGALGFIVFVDIWELLTRRVKRLCLTTKVICATTFILLVAGTGLVFLTEKYGGIAGVGERFLFSAFQVISAATTTGYNTVNIAAMSKPAALVLCLLMIVGASPSGTGGGLRTTTVSTIFAAMKSTLYKYRSLRLLDTTVPPVRFRAAVATVGFYFFILAAGVYCLMITENLGLFDLLFEATSALSGVGLSLGITTSLSTAGKFIIISLMYIGRVGVLTMGMVFAWRPARGAAPRRDDLTI
jgi:trk system potassium uptake protein TrkH